MNATQEIESGNFSVPRWNLFSPDSIRIVNWNIDRGLKLRGVIEFLDSTKADIILLQEVDLNARRTHHINIASKTIVTYDLHLESRGDDQLRCFQLDEVLDDARRYNSNTPILLTGDFNLDVSGGPAAAAIGRAEFLDAFTNQHVPTTPGSFLEHGRTIDWVFTRGPIRAGQAQVHRSVSASDHYPQSVKLTIG